MNLRILLDLPERMRAAGVPGAQAALVEAGAVRIEAGFGVADAASARPVTTTTVFQAASIAKTVTAWAVLALVEDGKIDLDQPIGRYVAGHRFPASRFDPKDVTVRRIMSHTAGLSLSDYPGFDPDRPHPGRDETLFGGSGDPLRIVETPGNRFRYSGGGWTLLQLAIEELTGEAFADHLERSVLRPLGMASSEFAWSGAIERSLATPYAEDGRRLPAYRYDARAAAGLYATAGDLARFLAAHVAGPRGEPAGRGVIGAAGLGELLRPVARTGRVEGLWDAYGLGYEIEPLGDGRSMVGHAGVNRGWRCRMALEPEARAGIVVLTNSDRGAAVVEPAVAAWISEVAGAGPATAPSSGPPNR